MHRQKPYLAMGYGGATFVDFSQPIGEPIQFRYIRRHRLQKKDPNAAMSEPMVSQ